MPIFTYHFYAAVSHPAPMDARTVVPHIMPRCGGSED